MGIHTNLAARLDRAIKAGNVPIVGVSIRDDMNKATWTVHPPSLQSAAQPIIDAFTVAEPLALPSLPGGAYLGALKSDPSDAKDGDLWLVREEWPSQRRVLKCRDGDVTRVLVTLVL